MRVAYFLHGFLPWSPYGVPQHIYELAPYFRARSVVRSVAKAFRQRQGQAYS